MTQRSLNTYLESAVAAVLLVGLVPAYGALAAAIRLDSGRPVLVRRHTHVERGERIHMLTFRTTDAGSEKLTPVGRLLQRTGLESLPSLWNVLMGEMPIASALEASAAVRQRAARTSPRAD